MLTFSESVPSQRWDAYSSLEPSLLVRLVLRRGIRVGGMDSRGALQGDVDTDGIGIGANGLKLNGGGIYDIAGNSAGLSHDTVAADSGQKVDASNRAGVSETPAKRDDVVRVRP